uniref:UBA domain-containing protein n=1 Tax=Heterorhabditis bacteriophora TaxID=37862 RepID=A0A1I7WYE2_HETBA
MSILEKQGVSSESSLSFLIESNIKDKLVVIDRAQTAAQLIGMGFVPSQVFAALVSAQGERVKALDILLGISAYQ